MPIRRVDVAFPTIDQVATDVAGDGGNAGAISNRIAGAQGDYVLMFRTARDGRVRPEHAALEGHVWELTDPDAPSPPLAPGCRCEVAIVPRDQAERRETSTSAEGLEKFKDLEKNLAQVYPADVVEAYRTNLLPADVIIQRTGDRISTAQARAIIASRRAELEPKAALQAVAALADLGISGRVLWPIVEDAQRRIDGGVAAVDAARAALMATTRRGSVTPATADKAARELVRSRLIGDGDPPRGREAASPDPGAGGDRPTFATVDRTWTPEEDRRDRAAVASIVDRLGLTTHGARHAMMVSSAALDADLDVFAMLGAYDPMGEVTVHTGIRALLERALDQVKAAAPLSMSEGYALKVVFHEDLHGRSPIAWGDAPYRGDIAAIEEMTTEVSARALAGRLSRNGDPRLLIEADSTATYQVLIDAAMALARGFDSRQVERDLVNAALRFKSRPARSIRTGSDAVHAWRNDLRASIGTDDG